LQAAYDACVLQVAATVFAATNLGRVFGIDQRGIEVALLIVEQGEETNAETFARPQTAVRAPA
jgi:hypothetical protein